MLSLFFFINLIILQILLLTEKGTCKDGSKGHFLIALHCHAIDGDQIQNGIDQGAESDVHEIVTQVENDAHNRGENFNLCGTHKDDDEGARAGNHDVKLYEEIERKKSK